MTFGNARRLAAALLLPPLLAPFAGSAQQAHSASQPAAVTRAATAPSRPLLHPVRIVVGFMGGRVHADNMVHREATVAQDLRNQHVPDLHVLVFANHDDAALPAVLKLVDQNGDHTVSDAERAAVQIAIYGHSWGASQTIDLARSLQKHSIPINLTVQVDSVQKPGQNDHEIPSNVAQAVNLYQRNGLLRGREKIRAQDPSRTRILVNERYTYDADRPVDIAKFPWFARTFMRQHIMIENDPELWARVERVLLEAAEGDTAITWASSAPSAAPSHN